MKYLGLCRRPSFLSSLSIFDKIGQAKWQKGFLTNTSKAEVSKRAPRLEQAARLAGTKLRMKENAYDISGNLIPSYSAFFLEDANKRTNFWQYLRQLDEQPAAILVEVKDFRTTKKTNIETLPARCDCSIVLLVRHGCQCDGN